MVLIMQQMEAKEAAREAEDVAALEDVVVMAVSTDQEVVVSIIIHVARSVFDWFADSGATSHMTDQLSLLMDYQPVELGSWMVTGIGGTSLPVHGQGNVTVITEVHHILKKNLFTHY